MSAFVESLANGARELFGVNTPDVAAASSDPDRLGMTDLDEYYEFLRRLWSNDPGTYTEIGKVETLDWTGVEGYRSVTRGIVEFYVKVLFTGRIENAHPFDVDPDVHNATNLQARAIDILHASNWIENKTLWKRLTAMLGDGWLQAAIKRNSAGTPVTPYLAVVDAQYVTSFIVDESGFVTYIRLDRPVQIEQGSSLVTGLNTEVWNKHENSFKVWESTHNKRTTPISQLRGQKTDKPMLETFGIDFVPYVQSKFLHDGGDRGVPAAFATLLKSAEGSRMATELHEKLFQYNQPDIQIVGSSQAGDGFTLSANDIDWSQPMERNVAGYRRVATPPVGHEIKPITSTVNYQAHMDAIEAHMNSLQKTDAPELAYYDRNESNQPGVALRIKLIPAIKAAEEVRSNMESGLIRAIQMALTLGQVNGIDGYSERDIGTFKGKDFRFTFTETDILPMSEQERAELWNTQADAGLKLLQLGFSPAFIQREVFGLTAEQIKEIEQEMPAEQAATRLLSEALARG